ncbi:hypothetical protein CDAR_518661 [Caerostris darwini]|uniref:Uncharacterized protein n=1 Tax=Caerostris darwini TaxID=1538125 RepID=A0AAV4UVF9_9ARAC|nr:hypothetical protein CDAR_518661 [Caerostris darwini]
MWDAKDVISRKRIGASAPKSAVNVAVLERRSKLIIRSLTLERKFPIPEVQPSGNVARNGNSEIEERKGLLVRKET